MQSGQAQGLVGRAVRQFVQIIADGGNGAAAQVGQLVGELGFAAGKIAQQFVDAVGKLGQAVQADDRQSAACLVQVRLRKLQLGRALLVGNGLVDGLQRAGERLVDFSLDPGQWAKVVLNGMTHECCLVARAFRIKP